MRFKRSIFVLALTGIILAGVAVKLSLQPHSRMNAGWLENPSHGVTSPPWPVEESHGAASSVAEKTGTDEQRGLAAVVNRPKLSREQLNAGLTPAQRSTASLLVAYRHSGDPAVLREAREKSPDDPRVQLATAQARDATPEERRAALDGLKMSAPENSLPDYLSALDHFKANQPDAAIQDLLAAVNKRGFDNYASDIASEEADAYAAAGATSLEAEAATLAASDSPDIAEFLELRRQLAKLQAQYLLNGDGASARSVVNIGVTLGRQLAGGAASVLQTLAGLSIERQFLQSLPRDAFADSSGQITAGDRVKEIIRQQNDISAMTLLVQSYLVRASAEDATAYFDHVKTSGDYAAMDWLRQSQPGLR